MDNHEQQKLKRTSRKTTNQKKNNSRKEKSKKGNSGKDISEKGQFCKGTIKNNAHSVQENCKRAILKGFI